VTMMMKRRMLIMMRMNILRRTGGLNCHDSLGGDWTRLEEERDTFGVSVVYVMIL